MGLLALIVAALVILGAPAVAAVAWVRSSYPSTDAIDGVAVAYAGVGIAGLALWLGTSFLGFGLWVLVLAPAVLSAIVIAAPTAARMLRGLTQDLDAAAASLLTGQHDGRVIPELVAAGGPAPATAPDGERARHFPTLALAGALFALLVLVPFATYGWERADGIHRMAMTDWYKHIVVTTALGNAEVFPPANPFVHGVEPAPYYYGFHLVAASIARLAGAPDAAYPALLLLTLLTALATPFVAYSVARGLAVSGMHEAPRAPLLAALSATFLAGFDLIPLAIDTLRSMVRSWPLPEGFAALRAIVPSTHPDYWIHHNERQFSAPYVTTIWAPQHMAGVLVALLVVHFVLQRGDVSKKSPRPAGFISAGLLPGLLLAGLPALSAYVALGLVAGVAGAVAYESLSQRRLPWDTFAWRIWFFPGIVAVVFSFPVLAVLAAGAGPGLTAEISSAGSWINGAFLTSWLGGGWFTGIIDSLVLYVVEFGVVGLLAWREIRRRSDRDRLVPAQSHVVALIVSIMVLVVIIRPAVGGPNNLYARSLVVVWFLMAPFAALALASRRRAFTDEPLRRHRLMAGLALCLLANVYALVGVLLEGGLFWAAPPDTVEAIEWVNEQTPADAVIAVFPDDYVSTFGYFARRRLSLADERHAALFGAGEAVYSGRAHALQLAYQSSTPEEAAGRFDALGADVIFVRLGEAGAALEDLPETARWARPPCFESGTGNGGWNVLRRVEGSCSGADR